MVRIHLVFELTHVGIMNVHPPLDFNFYPKSFYPSVCSYTKNVARSSLKTCLGDNPQFTPQQQFMASTSGSGLPPTVSDAPSGSGRHVRQRRKGKQLLTKGQRASNMQPKKPRKVCGKPSGWLRKKPVKTSVSLLLAAYLDLKAELESLQSRVQRTAAFVKPSLNNEAALTALQELEQVAMNISTVPSTAHDQNQQPPQPEQPLPQPPLPQSTDWQRHH